jgi:tripeptidyl-peptidase-1
MRGFKHVLRIASFLLVSCAVLASTTIRDWTFRLKEKVGTPRGWTRLNEPSPLHIIRLRIGLSQPGFRELEKQLLEISDPYHHDYGKYLSKEEVDELAAPHKNSIVIVDEWLESFGIAKSHVARSPANDWVMINVSVTLAEEMLNTVSPDQHFYPTACSSVVLLS